MHDAWRSWCLLLKKPQPSVVRLLDYITEFGVIDLNTHFYKIISIDEDNKYIIILNIPIITRTHKRYIAHRIVHFGANSKNQKSIGHISMPQFKTATIRVIKNPSYVIHQIIDHLITILVQERNKIKFNYWPWESIFNIIIYITLHIYCSFELGRQIMVSMAPCNWCNVYYRSSYQLHETSTWSHKFKNN